MDPTIKVGYPLWYGSDNWEISPDMDGNIPPEPPRKSFYTDIIYWAKRPDSSLRPEQVPMRALFCLVASEWNTIVNYVRTRLGHIAWEVSYQEYFLTKGRQVDDLLKKLYVWRRLIPMYRQLLTETLERVFQVKSDGTAILSPLGKRNQEALIVGDENPMREEFALVLSRMQDLQYRVDAMTSVLVAMNESQKTAAGNQSVARLTWLATCFIPLSFVTGLFSMTEDVGTLRQTMKWYFAAALPLALVSLGLAAGFPYYLKG